MPGFMKVVDDHTLLIADRRGNGEAVDPALNGQFEVQGRQPRSVIVVNVKEAYIHCSRAPCDRPLGIPPTAWNAARFAGFVEAKAVDGEIRKRVRSLSTESYRRFLLKKSIVRVHASFAAASSYRGVVSLWKP
jgi:hypothetical protein